MRGQRIGRDPKPDPKPRKRHKADITEWRSIIVPAKIGLCRVCEQGVYGPDHFLSFHHLVGKDAGGDDVPDNIVPVYGSGTTACHGLIEAYDRETCQALRMALREEEVRYVDGRKGRAWLDRRYPLPPGAEDPFPNKEKDVSAGYSLSRSLESARWL